MSRLLCDPENTTLLDGLSEAEKQNFPLLLKLLDGRFTYHIGMLRSQIAGKISSQAAGSANREERLKKLEHCPCAVHRDPAHTCVVLDTHERLNRIEAKIDAKMDAKISPLKLKLAYILGGVAVVAFLLDLAARMLPIFWR